MKAIRRGLDSGPLRLGNNQQPSRGRGIADPTVILSQLPMEIIATLHVLVDIELSRRERYQMKAKPSIDVLQPTREDAVLK